MKLHAIHTCPLWELPGGRRRIGFDHHPCGGVQWPVVGWVNVMVMTIQGRRVKLLAVDTDFDS